MDQGPSNKILSSEDSTECAICLQPCMQPVQLPCSHIFCFLCAKGAAMQSHQCALCRSTIPKDFSLKPTLFVKSFASDAEMDSAQPRYVWFYQGYNGWWQYDERTCQDIETAYSNNVESVDVLIAGSVYVIDFKNQIQYQRNRNSRKRKIKRDLATADKKGVAGLESESLNSVASTTPSQEKIPSLTDVSDMQSNTSIMNSNMQGGPEIIHNSISVDFHQRQVPVGSEEHLVGNQTTSSNSSLFQPPLLMRDATVPVPSTSPMAPLVDLRRCNSDTVTAGLSEYEAMD